MSDTPALRPIDRIFTLAIDKGFAKDGKVSIRGLAKAAGIEHSQLIRARDSETGRLREDAYEALAKALETTVSYFIGEAPATAAASSAGDIILVAYRRLVPWERNHRKSFSNESLAELADSIAEKGVLENLIARPMADKLQIGAGERRWRAIGLLVEAGRWDQDEANIPVKVVDEPEDDEFLATGLAENEQREDPNPIEAAEGYAEMIAMNPEKWRPSSIAKRLGKSSRHVQQRLALVNKLAPEVQQAVRDGLVNFTQARVLTMADAGHQKELVRKIDSFKTAEQLRDTITAGMVPASRAMFDLSDYAGTIATNEDTGTRYFGSKEEFLAAQKTAAQAKAEALQGEWAWALYVEGYQVPLWQYDRGAAAETRGVPALVTYAFAEEDRRRAGAIVHFDPYDGKVTIHAGLLQKEEKQEDPEEAARRQAETVARQQALAAQKAALSGFADRLQAALRADPKGATRLLLIYPALPYSHSVPFDPSQVAGVDKDRINGGCYGFLARFVAPADEHGIQVLKPDADPVAVWKAALSVSDKVAAEAMASFVAASIVFNLNARLDPFTVALADHYGVDVPEELRPARPAAPAEPDIEDAIDAGKAADLRKDGEAA